MTAYDERTVPRPLPIGPAGYRTPGWWGVLALIGTEMAVFAYLLFSYFYLQSQTPEQWPPSGLPPLHWSAPSTLILLVSAATMWWADRGMRFGKLIRLYSGIGATILLGCGYVVLQCFDWNGEPFLANSGAYASLFYAITAFHVLHAAVGVLILAAVAGWTVMGYITPQRRSAITVVALYWYFVVVAWIAVFITLYLLPWITPH
ncbi:MAG TPA: cytochrome c oxidase subunit 3 [Rhodanobacteraceae bacterium]|nr:cytochrome c oxidase subunit 3 [Rhodanobacteraceae bacterium]